LDRQVASNITYHTILISSIVIIILVWSAILYDPYSIETLLEDPKIQNVSGSDFHKLTIVSDKHYLTIVCDLKDKEIDYDYSKYLQLHYFLDQLERRKPQPLYSQYTSFINLCNLQISYLKFLDESTFILTSHHAY